MRDLAEAYPELTEQVSELAYETFGEFDEYGLEQQPHRISAQSYDGFIAHTNGGVRLQMAQSLSDHYNTTGEQEKIIAPYYNEAINDAAEDFARERELYEAWQASDSDQTCYEWLSDRWQTAELDHVEILPLLPDEPKVEFWRTDIGAERAAFWQYESDYLREGGAYLIDFTAIYYAADHRRNITGSDELYIFAGINTDFEYGREKGLQCTFERTYKVSQLSYKRLDAIISAAAASIRA